MNNDYIAKAQSKEQKGDLEGALIDYHKALEKDPKNNAIQNRKML